MTRSLHIGLSAAAAGFAVLALPASGRAQEVSAAEAVARCRTLPNDSERILCLEQALLTEPSAPAPAPAAPAPAPAAPAVAAPAAVAPVAAAPVAGAPAAGAASAQGRGLRLPSVPFFGRDDRDRETAVVSSDDPMAEEFGAVAVAAADDEPDIVPRMVAGVVSASEVAFHRLEVELDNGQVWRQIESDRIRWDARRYDEPENVEIWPTGLGGYRMLVTSANVTLRVERVE